MKCGKKTLYLPVMVVVVIYHCLSFASCPQCGMDTLCVGDGVTQAIVVTLTLSDAILNIDPG